MLKMFTKKDKLTSLEKEIESLLKILSTYKPDTEEYSAIAANLEVLYKAKSYDRSRHVSPDVIATVAGNLLGIALILGYERAEVITTKALGFVMKGRV